MPGVQEEVSFLLREKLKDTATDASFEQDEEAAGTSEQFFD